MEDLITWVIDNKEWLFSGVGLLVVAWVVRHIFKKKTYASSTQTIRSGDSSTNIQAGRDAKIVTKKMENDEEKG